MPAANSGRRQRGEHTSRLPDVHDRLARGPARLAPLLHLSGPWLLTIAASTGPSSPSQAIRHPRWGAPDER
jgi:hypothetical protein